MTILGSEFVPANFASTRNPNPNKMRGTSKLETYPTSLAFGEFSSVVIRAMQRTTSIQQISRAQQTLMGLDTGILETPFPVLTILASSGTYHCTVIISCTNGVYPFHNFPSASFLGHLFLLLKSLLPSDGSLFWRNSSYIHSNHIQLIHRILH